LVMNDLLCMCVNYHLVFRLGKTKKLLSIWFPAEPPVALIA
jgi:hypothetical protein